jgi:hypothetical protein
MWGRTLVIPATQEAEAEHEVKRPVCAKLARFCLKNKRAGGTAEVAEYLPGMNKALESILSTEGNYLTEELL